MILLGFASINSDAFYSCSQRAADSPRDEGCKAMFELTATIITSALPETAFWRGTQALMAVLRPSR